MPKFHVVHFVQFEMSHIFRGTANTSAKQKRTHEYKSVRNIGKRLEQEIELQEGMIPYFLSTDQCAEVSSAGRLLARSFEDYKVTFDVSHETFLRASTFVYTLN